MQEMRVSKVLSFLQIGCESDKRVLNHAGQSQGVIKKEPGLLAFILRLQLYCLESVHDFLA